MSIDAAVERIASDLHATGVRPGDVLLVHASMRALGVVPGGAATVIAGLSAALGPEGTLLMPALSYATVTRERPHFDLALTPSNVGVLAETFRRQAGALRSLHPTHSVCGLGMEAAALLGEHSADHTPCGPHSPFHRLPEFHGKILMLGCGLHPNTSFHAIEEIVEPPYLFGAPVDYELIDSDGRRTVKRYISHDFVGYRQRYDRIGQMLGSPALRVGRVLDAAVHLLDASEMWRMALDTLRQDPFAFVEAITQD